MRHIAHLARFGPVRYATRTLCPATTSDPFTKEIRMGTKTVTALLVFLTTLILTLPAFAKDQWVVAFGEEPFTLNPANKGALAAVSDYVQVHIFDALVDVTGTDLLTLKPMLAERWENPSPARGASTSAAA